MHTLHIKNFPHSKPGEMVADLVELTMTNADAPLDRDAVDAAARALVTLVCVANELNPMSVEMVIGVISLNFSERGAGDS